MATGSKRIHGVQGYALSGHVNKAHKINTKIAEDPNEKAGDRSDASIKAYHAQLFLFMLIREGPDFINQRSWK